jgi:hypothetical protein
VGRTRRGQVLAGIQQHRRHGWELSGEHGRDLVDLSVTSWPLGWAKIVRMAAATISADPRGTRASTLRRKWTRQRCQPAPAMTAAMAALRPV